MGILSSLFRAQDKPKDSTVSTAGSGCRFFRNRLYSTRQLCIPYSLYMNSIYSIYGPVKGFPKKIFPPVQSPDGYGILEVG